MLERAWQHAHVRASSHVSCMCTSQLESWGRVVAGLLRMYEGEVLGKLQVVQHLPFGTLLPWE